MNLRNTTAMRHHLHQDQRKGNQNLNCNRKMKRYWLRKWKCLRKYNNDSMGIQVLKKIRKARI